MRRLLYLLSVGLLALAATVVPMPLLVTSPAPATPVTDVLEVEARDVDDLNGTLMLTTVAVSEPAVVDAVEAYFDPYEDIALRGELIPPNVDEAEFFRTQRDIFDESVRIAAAVGLREAGLEVDIRGDGARVVRIVPGSPADGTLQEDDIVVRADGRPVRLAAELAAITTAKEEGAVVTLTVERDGTREDVRVQVGAIPGSDQVGIGVLVETENQRIDLPTGVEVTNASSIGGPSAGLMLALTTYDLFQPDDLTDGRRIAGTGTLTLTGQVGPIGGIEQKVRGAISSDADVFLAPALQVEAARAAAGDDIEIIGVDTLEEAIRALSTP